MLFVFLAHFGNVYFRSAEHDFLGDIVEMVGMVATPTFVILSGAMLGLLHHTRKDRFDSIRRKLLDRGIFFLLVGHPLIALAHYPFGQTLANSFRYVFITDTIAFAIIAGPILIGRIGPLGRGILAIGIFVASWLLSLSWFPVGDWGLILKSALVGEASGERRVLLYSFPLLPWFSVYLAGTWLGESLRFFRDPGGANNGIRIIRLCTLFVVGSAAICALFLRGVHRGLFSVSLPDWGGLLLGPFQKVPPGPVYIAFYGGIGFFLLTLWGRADGNRHAGPLSRVTELLGRNSFFVFVAQYYVYLVGLPLLHLAFAPWWPLYLVVSGSLLVAGAAAWERLGGNRLLTVGLSLRPGSGGRSGPMVS